MLCFVFLCHNDHTKCHQRYIFLMSATTTATGTTLSRFVPITLFVSSLLLLLLQLAVPTSLALETTNNNTDAITTIADSRRRIIAVGDVHGDIKQLKAILQMAEVIDADGHWIAPAGTTVVQVGDLMDRGPQDKEVMDMFMQMQKDAAAAGSKVVCLLGNHEIMNLQGQFHYVHPDSHEDFGGKVSRKRDFSSTTSTYGGWLRSLPVVHVEGSTVFVHAGLSPSFASLGVEQINRLARETLQSRRIIDNQDRIFGVHGPVWTRLLITDAMNNRCDDVHRAIRLLGQGVKRMVVGHTPQRSGRIESFCDDALIAIDVGLSKWMYGNLAALEITEMTQMEGEETSKVELREIFPHATPSSASPVKGDDSGDDSAGGGVASSDAVLRGVDDPMVLQELMELIQEAKLRDKERDAEALDSERHEEL